jgi:hypothetical protein
MGRFNGRLRKFQHRLSRRFGVPATGASTRWLREHS